MPGKQSLSERLPGWKPTRGTPETGSCEQLQPDGRGTVPGTAFRDRADTDPPVGTSPGVYPLAAALGPRYQVRRGMTGELAPHLSHRTEMPMATFYLGLDTGSGAVMSTERWAARQTLFRHRWPRNDGTNTQVTGTGHRPHMNSLPTGGNKGRSVNSPCHGGSDPGCTRTSRVLHANAPVPLGHQARIHPLKPLSETGPSCT